MIPFPKTQTEMKLTNTRDYQIGVQLRSIHIFFPESGFSVYFESEMKSIDYLTSRRLLSGPLSGRPLY